jgi:hypothetical protein
VQEGDDEENETESPVRNTVPEDTVTCTHFLQCQSQDARRSKLPRCDFQSTDAADMEYNVGKWLPVTVPYSPSERDTGKVLDQFAYNYQPACNRGPFRCHIAEPHSCGKRMLQMLRYHWQPDTCELKSFDAAQMERMWAGKRVLYIGDSLMRQQFNSMRFLMQRYWKSPEDGKRRDPEYFETKSGARVDFMWSKYLLEERLLPQRLALPEQNWPDLVGKADWVVMNVGHHWHKKDSRYSMP